MFPEDDRVVALFADARRQFGDDILRDPRRSVPLLADQAPELRNAIKATAVAISIGAAQRLRAAPDQASEFHRLASEITGREGIAIPDAMTGVRIAARLGGGGPMSGPAAEDRSWVGGGATQIGAGPGHGSPAFGAPAPPPGGAYGQGAPPYGAPGYGQPGFGQAGVPPVPPAAGPQDFMRGKWGVAALVGAAILVVVGLSSGSDKSGQSPQAPQSGPSDGPAPSPPAGRPPPQGGGRPPPQSAGLPIVVPPGGGQQPPAIQVREAQQAYVLEFGVSGGNQVLRVIVGISRQGWDSGFVAVASQGANEPESLSQTGPFRLSRQNNNAIRVLQPQWQRDGLNIGTVCVAFVQGGAQDVQLRGSNVCVLGGNCDKMVGCGVVQ